VLMSKRDDLLPLLIIAGLLVGWFVFAWFGG
jgi:hypothetical protein